MKRQIRKSVFETNSSSTHAVAILTDKEYRDYTSGELMISRNGEIITKQEYEALVAGKKENAKKYWEKNDNLRERYPDFEQYWFERCDETLYDFDENNMDVIHSERTVNGENVHALSVYGYDY